MIPPFETNHASFLELLPNGDMLLAWFSGTKEGRDNVSIVISRLKNGTDQWSKATLVARREGYSNQNPVLYYDNKTKILHLFHSQQPATTKHLTEYDANVWTQNSTDMGMTWSPPYDVFSKNASFDRNRVFHRLNGEWALPMYYAGELLIVIFMHSNPISLQCILHLMLYYVGYIFGKCHLLNNNLQNPIVDMSTVCHV